MSKPDDLYRLHRLLDGRRSTISRQTLIDELEISRSKLTRLIASSPSCALPLTEPAGLPTKPGTPTSKAAG
ncbi:hypothetical protein [Ferrovum sp.]|uniref:hypothetical protein n=1 Tax=Ferrovum sp. TaxID=2609467 RepID=UPI00262DBECA|nr:hypothetical protein [Ferrovum sp.]